jgi:hypothetical protein
MKKLKVRDIATDEILEITVSDNPTEAEIENKAEAESRRQILLKERQKADEAAKTGKVKQLTPDQVKAAGQADQASIDREIARLGGAPPPSSIPAPPPAAGMPEVEDNGLALVPAARNTAPAPVERDTSGAAPGERFLGGMLGGGAGVLSAAAQGVVGNRDAAAVKRAGLEETARIAAQKSAGMVPPTGGVPATGGLPGSSIPIGPNDAGRMAPGQTGIEPYNKAKAIGLTDIEAAQALDQSKKAQGAYGINERRINALEKIQNLYPNQFKENPMFGGIMTPDRSAGSGPRATFVDKPAVPPTPEVPAGQPGGLQQLPKTQPIPTAPKPPSAVRAGLDEVTNIFKNMIRPVGVAAKTVGKFGIPIVGGVGAGLDAMELAHEYDKPEADRDYGKMINKGVGLAGGALSMFPPTMPLGAAMSLGSAGYDVATDPEKRAYVLKKLQEMRDSGYVPSALGGR